MSQSQTAEGGLIHVQGTAVIATTRTAQVRRTRGRTRTRFTSVELVILALFVLALIAAAVGPSLLRERTIPGDTVTVKVTRDQTLWGIASANPIQDSSTAETVSAIQDLNGLSDSTIVAGQLLMVPSELSGAVALAER